MNQFDVDNVGYITNVPFASSSPSPPPPSSSPPATPEMTTVNSPSSLATNQSFENGGDPMTFIRVHCPTALLIDRYVTPIWYVLGSVGNVLSFLVWRSRRMRRNNSSAIYLSALSASDLVFLTLHLFQELKYAWFVNAVDFPVVCQVYYVLSMVTQYLSPTLVLCFTTERYIAVCHPFLKERHCTGSRALKVVLASILLCVALSSVQGYFWIYDGSSGTCEIRLVDLWTAWTWISEMMVFFLIPVIILVFNVLVIAEVKKKVAADVKMGASRAAKQTPSSEKRSRVKERHLTDSHGSTSSAASTVMLLSVSFYVIVTTLPATLFYALYDQFPMGDPQMSDEEIRRDPVWQRHSVYLLSRKIAEEICLSHYACNIFLYFSTGKQFRRALKLVFQKCLSRMAIEPSRTAICSSCCCSVRPRNFESYSSRTAEEGHQIVSEL